MNTMDYPRDCVERLLDAIRQHDAEQPASNPHAAAMNAKVRGELLSTSER